MSNLSAAEEITYRREGSLGFVSGILIGAGAGMKVARWLLGRFPSPHFRRPIRPLPEVAIDQIRAALAELAITL